MKLQTPNSSSVRQGELFAALTRFERERRA